MNTGVRAGVVAGLYMTVKSGRLVIRSQSITAKRLAFLKRLDLSIKHAIALTGTNRPKSQPRLNGCVRSAELMGRSRRPRRR